jgi:hypothetical protein
MTLDALWIGGEVRCMRCKKRTNRIAVAYSTKYKTCFYVCNDCFGVVVLKAAPETAGIPVLALRPWAFGSDENAPEEDGIEFVLMQENELVEERLLSAITLLFKREKPAGGES